ncbi:hypothetical protein BASA81_015191 [Batrachochytrium salamandrivorans]|nr:hypothetical protein BASA81_015191 [Batrachochytrium salamandrivorans]
MFPNSSLFLLTTTEGSGLDRAGMECRLCRCSDDFMSPLLSPCECSGTMKYAHDQCLQEYFKVSGQVSCSVCDSDFTLVPKGQPCLVAFAVLEWVQITAVLFAFPGLALQGRWYAAGAAAMASMTFLILPVYLLRNNLQHEYMKIAQKAARWEVLADLGLFSLGVGEITLWFVWYVSTWTPEWGVANGPKVGLFFGGVCALLVLYWLVPNSWYRLEWLGRLIRPGRDRGSLASIVPLREILKRTILDVVHASHRITVHALQFLKLYLLSCFENGVKLPLVTEHLVVSIMNVLCEESEHQETRGRRCNPATLTLKQKLLEFHREHYKLTMTNPREKLGFTNKAQLLHRRGCGQGL